MSERSAAWYAIPANAEKRRARMRLYARAMSALAREHPLRYRALCREHGAQQRAYGAIRDEHPERFTEILDGLADEAERSASCRHEEPWGYDDLGNHWCMTGCRLWHDFPHHPWQDEAHCREQDDADGG